LKAPCPPLKAEPGYATALIWIKALIFKLGYILLV
jgi:hypothetical protein